jgi:endogenous inhibitor of DNA gyrase (YacG/DUF329 family)
MADKRTLSCPTCHSPSDYFAKPVGPFCSDRCQMVDLGKWMNEEYRVSESLKPHHLEELEEMEERQRYKDSELTDF